MTAPAHISSSYTLPPSHTLLPLAALLVLSPYYHCIIISLSLYHYIIVTVSLSGFTGTSTPFYKLPLSHLQYTLPPSHTLLPLAGVIAVLSLYHYQVSLGHPSASTNSLTLTPPPPNHPLYYHCITIISLSLSGFTGTSIRFVAGQETGVWLSS